MSGISVPRGWKTEGPNVVNSAPDRNGQTAYQQQDFRPPIQTCCNGRDGRDGKDGRDGIDAIGPSAYDVWLSLGNVGTEFDFIASLKGPAGDPCEPCKDGVDGVDGVDGRDGVDGQDGDSAYDVWIKNGNVGSEADFLESLVGTDGVDGEDCDCSPSCIIESVEVELRGQQIVVTITDSCGNVVSGSDSPN